MASISVFFVAFLAVGVARGAFLNETTLAQKEARTFYIPIGPPIQRPAPTPVAPPPVATPPPSANLPACPSTNSEAFHKVCEYEINSIRYTHQAPPVTYSMDLANAAKVCANNFARAGSINTPACIYQNAGVTVGFNPNDAPSQGARSVITDLEEGWYSEYVQGFVTFPNPRYDPQAHNMPQMVWRSTRTVGCGYSDTKAPAGAIPNSDPNNDSHVMVCLWDPAGGTPSLYPANVLEDIC